MFTELDITNVKMNKIAKPILIYARLVSFFFNMKQVYLTMPINSYVYNGPSMPNLIKISPLVWKSPLRVGQEGNLNLSKLQLISP